MLVSNSVIRRYTPPTCTLQLVARSSPLSRWIGQSVLKQLQFELKFDDPRLPEEKRVTIQGDREQLEVLHEAIANYIQDLLKQSPERFNAVLSGGLTPPSSNTAASLKPPPIGLIASDSQALSEESPSLDCLDNASAHLEIAEITPEDSLVTQNEAIFLQPGRGLSHDLYLGSLANEESGALIQLSVLQLFDLATALDEYAVDVMALPTQSPRRRIADTTTQTWGSIAAVLVLAVGLVSVVQSFNRSDSQQQTANNSTTSGSSSNNDQQLTALGPLLTPTLSPLPIPSLPPVGSTLQPPSSPSFPTGTLPGTSSPFNSARQTNGSQTTLVIPDTPREKIPQKTPTNSTPRGTSATSIVINPEPKQQNRSVSSPKNAAQKTSVVPPPSSPVTQLSPSSQPSPSTPIASVPSKANPVNPPASESNTTAQQSPAVTATAPEQPNGRLFDTIPQVAEVREYFKQRWQPPSGLTQPLYYNLTVGVNGTIQRIEPLGQQAKDFVDRTDIPLSGESFISPDTNGKTHIIRLTLFPDGKVETMLVSGN